MALPQVTSYPGLVVVSVFPEMPFDLLIFSDSELSCLTCLLTLNLGVLSLPPTSS